jgi:hypothetical protein
MRAKLEAHVADRKRLAGDAAGTNAVNFTLPVAVLG